MAFGFKRKKEDALDKQTDDLYNQIGRLKMENEWLKKVEMRFYEVMKVMDKLYTQDCTLGSRRYAETLKEYE
jgi:hypothetical protein